MVAPPAGDLGDEFNEVRGEGEACGLVEFLDLGSEDRGHGFEIARGALIKEHAFGAELGEGGVGHVADEVPVLLGEGGGHGVSR